MGDVDVTCSSYEADNGLMENMHIRLVRHGSKPCDTFEQSGSESSIAQSSQPMVSGRGRSRPL